MKNQTTSGKTLMGHPYLHVALSDKIAVVSLCNPPGNALRISLLNKLDKTIGELSVHPGVKVILITGRERIFSSGTDIKEMSLRKSAKHARAMSTLGQRVCLKIENCPKPIIAAINGFCLGGGLELAMSCHLRIASDHAIMGMPEISLGMIPAFGGSYRLPHLVGKGKAIELILSGRKIRSEEALAIGLVDRVVPKETLLSETLKCAEKWTSKSAVSMKLALRSITLGSDTDVSGAMEIESTCLEELYDSYDLREGIFAFLENRKSEFRDC